MGAISAYLGKGLSEPCSPYRMANVFGAPLNSPNAAGWNCLPTIVGSTTSFDLSGISENHEVCVALVRVSNARAGTYLFRFQFYKESPYKKLFDYTFSFFAVEGGWCYSYAYIGWTSWEINQNGGYSVSVSVSGPESYSNTIYFSVSGIPAAVPMPPPAPVTGTGIVSALNSVSSWFYNLYRDVYYYPVIGQVLATGFYWLAELFSTLAWGFSSFFTSFNELWAKAANILSWSSIWSYILIYVPNLTQIRDWFYYWWTNVTSAVSSWWSATQVTVLAWVQDAKNFASSLVAGVSSVVTQLQSAWDNFKGLIPTLDEIRLWWGNWTGNVLAAIDTWWTGKLVDIQGLINSAFLARQSFWAGWQEIRTSVLTFFQDPVEFIWQRFADWFLGPEG